MESAWRRERQWNWKGSWVLYYALKSSPMARMDILRDTKEVSLAITELVRPHDDVGSRDLVSDNEVRKRTEQFRKAALEEKTSRYPG